MKKKFLSFLLVVFAAFGLFAGCGDNVNSSGGSSGSTPPIKEVDYAGEVTLNTADVTLTQEVTVKAYIDGDTTHFNVPTSIDPNGLLKARYMAVNTPESTGTVEPWGKAAASFTKSKLQSASKIVIETDADKWEPDSTGDRYLVWVWYLPQGETQYRNLNVELLQNGLAVGSKITNTRYAKACTNALAQAKALSLKVFSTGKDPDFYYGNAYEITLKELRLNIEEYNNKRVAFEATVTIHNVWEVYLEDYDEETGLYYGISLFYGYDHKFDSILAAGNRVRIVANVTYYETGGYHQLSSLSYDIMNPTDPENTQQLSTGNRAGYVATDIDTFYSSRTLTLDVYDEDTEETTTVEKTFSYAQLVYGTTISMQSLEVISAYTTNNGGANDGAMSLTCKINGKTITVRTEVLKNASGELLTQDMFVGKTIDVKGIVDYYNGNYQIRVFYPNAITIVE